MGPTPEPHGDDPSCAEYPLPDARETPRITLMLRAGKLIFGDAELLCVLRDVSEHGVKVRLFHPLPEAGVAVSLELGSGTRYPLEKIWEEGEEAGFRFVGGPVELGQVVEEAGPFPRRHLRLKVDVPAVVNTIAGARMGFVQDISQLGAMIACDPPLAIGARVAVTGPGLPELEGRVRWRKRDAHGLVFTRGFRLDELARLADALQRGETDPAARNVG